MKNSLVLEQDYIQLIQNSKLSAKEQLKIIYALSDFVMNNYFTVYAPKLKRKSLDCYNKILQLMLSKKDKRSQKYRDNIRKRWNKENTTVLNENTIVSDKNTVVSNENTIVSKADTTVSNNLYNCIQSLINKHSMVSEGQKASANVDNSDAVIETEQMDESANINNNIINTQSKREDIVNNNITSVSFVNEEEIKNLNKTARAQFNTFNSNNIINIGQRVTEKSEEQRKILYDLYNIHPSQFKNEYKEIFLEVIDTLIEAILQANSPLGLKFRQINYHLSEFIDIVLGLSAFEISNIVKTLYGNLYAPNSIEINNRPYYILGMFINLSKGDYYLFNGEHTRSSDKVIFKLISTNETGSAESAPQPISVWVG